MSAAPTCAEAHHCIGPGGRCVDAHYSPVVAYQRSGYHQRCLGLGQRSAPPLRALRRPQGAWGMGRVGNRPVFVRRDHSQTITAGQSVRSAAVLFRN
jgi:hypothetical protein